MLIQKPISEKERKYRIKMLTKIEKKVQKLEKVIKKIEKNLK